MGLLQDTINKIGTPNQHAMNIVAGNLDKLDSAKGYQLGFLRELLLKYIGATSTDDDYAEYEPKIATIICCADHGVANEAVSAYPPETTLNMTANYLISQGSAANAMANFVGSRIYVADLGINADASNLPGLINMRIASGTENSVLGPAMSRRKAIQSIENGIRLVQQAIADGAFIILPGEMGISNTTASAAITAAICQLPAIKTTGRGTNISDERLRKKIATVEKILSVNKPDPTDAIDVLSKVGGFELGALAGIILGAAAERRMIILDGFNNGSAALIAHLLCPDVIHYMSASHIASEQGHKYILQHLDLKPCMKLDIKLGEAIGSSLVADALVSALQSYLLLCESDELKIQIYDKLNIEYMPPEEVTLTDKTFDYYTNTMQEPDTDTMSICQQRMNNLAKPIYSMGQIENIARQLAGILGDELPALDINKKILFIGINKDSIDQIRQNTSDSLLKLLDSGKDIVEYLLSASKEELLKIANKTEEECNEGNDDDMSLTFDQAAILCAFSNPANIIPGVSNIYIDRNQMDAFEFGRQLGENYSLGTAVLGLAITDGKYKEYIQGITDCLVNPDGTLKYSKTEFLGKLPHDYSLLVAGALGAMLAAAHNCTLIILDDAAVAAVARYAALLVPEISHYLLPIQPLLYQMDIKAPGVAACLGMRLVDASLHMLNDMRTFSDTQVSVANDGPGKGVQI